MPIRSAEGHAGWHPPSDGGAQPLRTTGSHSMRRRAGGLGSGHGFRIPLGRSDYFPDFVSLRMKVVPGCQSRGSTVSYGKGGAPNREWRNA